MGGRKQKFIDNSLSIARRVIIISSSQSVLNKTLWLVSRTKFQDQTAHNKYSRGRDHVTLCLPPICHNNFTDIAF